MGGDYGPSVSISGSSIHSNGYESELNTIFFFRPEFIIDARDNWWNATDILEIQAWHKRRVERLCAD